jgi:hypothetical protein
MSHLNTVENMRRRIKREEIKRWEICTRVRGQIYSPHLFLFYDFSIYKTHNPI